MACIWESIYSGHGFYSNFYGTQINYNNRSKGEKAMTVVM